MRACPCVRALWFKIPAGSFGRPLMSLSVVQKRRTGAEGRDRTGTGLAAQRFLRPSRLPVPPLRHKGVQRHRSGPLVQDRTPMGTPRQPQHEYSKFTARPAAGARSTTLLTTTVLTTRPGRVELVRGHGGAVGRAPSLDRCASSPISKAHCCFRLSLMLVQPPSPAAARLIDPRELAAADPEAFIGRNAILQGRTLTVTSTRIIPGSRCWRSYPVVPRTSPSRRGSGPSNPGSCGTNTTPYTGSWSASRA